MAGAGITSDLMLAKEDSSDRTMLKALSVTSNALDAAILLDVDRSDDDRAFFQSEKLLVDAAFDQVATAERAVYMHALRETHKIQMRIIIGDAVLDRGYRAGKKRTTLEKGLQVADNVFGDDVSEIVNAEREVEPDLVLTRIDQLVKVDDFPGKTTLVTDLTGRAQRQQKNFADRNAADRVEADLDATLRSAIARGADVLYTLEKRLYERFPRDKVYVRAFFLDTGSKRKK